MVAKSKLTHSGWMFRVEMKYTPIEEKSQSEVEAAILRNEAMDLSQAVLSAALFSNDPDWSERICLQLSNHQDVIVRGNAILGFGHIARIHGQLNESRVKPVIEAALRDESDYVRGQANSAADDVAFFLNWRVAREVAERRRSKKR